MSYSIGLSSLGELAKLRGCRSRSVSSYDRTGGNKDYVIIKPGERKVIAEIDGAGAIRHIWFGGQMNEEYWLRKVLLRMYWDGELEPSVEVPMGDFFGVGHGLTSHFISLLINMIIADRPDAPARNCYFPMPFSNSCRIEIENDGATPYYCYFQVDYEIYDILEENAARFHAQWRRENPTRAVVFGAGEEEINLTGEENYVILEAEGRGHYVGCVLNVHNLSTGWWGEGDVMIFVDGEKWPPSFHGTGTEDYFCSSYGFPHGGYCGLFTGVSLVGNPKDYTGKWSVYRFHIEDPIVFYKSIRVTIEHGHANNRSDDYSSVAYWYQAEPHKSFPPMPKVEERLPRK